MISFLVAHIIPVINYIRYYQFKQKIRKSAAVQLGVHGAKIKTKATKEEAKETDERLAFASDKSYDKWELNDNSLGAASKQLEKVSKKDLTEKIAAMDTVMNVHEKLSEAAKGKSGTKTNDKFDGATKKKPPNNAILSPMWRLTKDAKKTDLVCGPTHE